jgi:hypothetical protein
VPRQDVRRQNVRRNKTSGDKKSGRFVWATRNTWHGAYKEGTITSDLHKSLYIKFGQISTLGQYRFFLPTRRYILKVGCLPYTKKQREELNLTIIRMVGGGGEEAPETSLFGAYIEPLSPCFPPPLARGILPPIVSVRSNGDRGLHIVPSSL